MRVLLCSPFNSEQNNNPGGIIVWTKNIKEYYDNSTDSKDLELEIYPLDRSVYVYGKSSRILRIWVGLKDYLRHAFRIYKKLHCKKYDIIHLSSSASFSLYKDWLILRIANILNVETVIHFHFGRIPELCSKNNWEWKLLKKVLQQSSKAIVMDARTYSVLKEVKDRVYNVPNPLSIQVTRTIDHIQVGKRTGRTVLFVGHVVKDKGVYDLVQACASIPNVQLKMVGKVLPKDKEIILSSLDDNSWIEFTGPLSYEKVLQEMLKCGVFVLPSYTEGFPNVIIESMYCGCPIVATNVGAIPEMLNVSNETCAGICVEPGDVEQLRNAIRLILDKINYAEKLGHNAKQRVVDEYSITAVWNMLNKIWCN